VVAKRGKKKATKKRRKPSSARAIIKANTTAVVAPAAGRRAAGRPAGSREVAIKWKTVQTMAKQHSTADEIAAVLECSTDTLSRHCQADHGELLEDYLTRYRAGGRASLRKLQWSTAQGGGKQAAAMQIWLGKNWLGQRSTSVNVSINGDAPLTRDNMIRVLQELALSVQEEIVDAIEDVELREMLLTSIRARWRTIFQTRLGDQAADPQPATKEEPTAADYQTAGTAAA
jgi:AraC-like DNA-binding protein